MDIGNVDSLAGVVGRDRSTYSANEPSIIRNGFLIIIASLVDRVVQLVADLDSLFRFSQRFPGRPRECVK